MNFEKIKIIPAEVKHARELAMLLVNAWQKAYKEIVPSNVLASFSIEARTESFANGIKNKTQNTHVCLYENEIAGFVTLGLCRDDDLGKNTGEIWGIYLDPKFWRKNIGTQMASWAIEYLKKEFKVSKIVLWVFKENISSRKFY
jgi:RimJ/RimL family protein N-acetyltransferase